MKRTCGHSTDHFLKFFMPEVCHLITRMPVLPKALFTANAKTVCFLVLRCFSPVN